MWRIGILGAVVVIVTLFGFSLAGANGSGDLRARSVLEAPNLPIEGFARAIEPFEWQFPRDFGAHPEFQTEWWYYTGNLTAETGERFGFQFTVFRRAITPEKPESTSEWRDNQMYLAHFTVSDISGGRFFHDQRFTRGGAELAGAVGEPRYRVWLEDWQVLAQDDEARLTRLTAETADFALDLTLEQVKPPALQGKGGLSPKSDEEGNASYYYTLSRLLTNGTLRVMDKTYNVSGVSWKDHEFSTSALGTNAQGWDWFSLIFDDGREMMVGQIRLTDGGKETAFGGLLVQPDGTTVYLPAETFTIRATDTWQSPHTGAVYPSGWEISIRSPEVTLNLMVTPLMQDQELYDANIAYWEGAISISGDVTGVGYAELTGYVDTMQGRF
mgnify:CR=1 FL=1